MRYVKVIAVLLAVVFVGAMYKVAVSSDIPATITIKDEAFGTLKKAPVEFTHERHFKELNVSCTECHHVYKDGKNVWKQGDPVKKCSACHKPVATEKDSVRFCTKTYKGKAPGLKCAYHMNCISCHKAEKKKGHKKAPTSCSKCHLKH